MTKRLIGCRAKKAHRPRGSIPTRSTNLLGCKPTWVMFQNNITSISDALIQKSGAEGGTRTPTGCPIRPSNVRVYQFHHFGNSGRLNTQQALTISRSNLILLILIVITALRSFLAEQAYYSCLPYHPQAWQVPPPVDSDSASHLPRAESESAPSE